MKSIIDMQLKIIAVMSSYPECNVMVSGGADSDIMVDMIDTVKDKIESNIYYYFVDTGLEYNATKTHIDYLQNKYNITIDKITPDLPIPLAVKKYGLPFLNKRVSDYLNRLQSHNFDFTDNNFKAQYEKYPHCKAALRWFYSDFEHPQYNINNNKRLYEYMITNPPPFNISKKCCDICKKAPLSKLNGLSVIGLRASEGGMRKKIKSCWNKETMTFYPLLFMNNDLKDSYKHERNITYSNCYETYGLKRTGCAGCPFGRNFETEIEIIKQYEPKLYNVCNNIFGESYEYTRKYINFKK